MKLFGFVSIVVLFEASLVVYIFIELIWFGLAWLGLLWFRVVLMHIANSYAIEEWNIRANSGFMRDLDFKSVPLRER